MPVGGSGDLAALLRSVILIRQTALGSGLDEGSAAVARNTRWQNLAGVQSTCSSTARMLQPSVVKHNRVGQGECGLHLQFSLLAMLGRWKSAERDRLTAHQTWEGRSPLRL